MVARMEGGLRTVNQLSESWPMDSLEPRGVGTNVDGGPQIEIPSGIMQGDVTEDDTQPVAVG